MLGLVINGASILVLGVEGGHGHDKEAHGHGHHHDHNFRSAYLHVLADALTSVLAIAALSAARFFGLTWLDPMMGVVGALLVARWSLELLRQSGTVLLDKQAPGQVLERVRRALEAEGDARVVDLHVWSIGPGRRAAIIALETRAPCALDAYRARLPRDLGVCHLTIEVAASRFGA